MQLSQEQSRIFLEWLNSKWYGMKKCPVCDNNSWNISDRVFEMREFYGGSMVLGGILQPVIPVTCANCGNTLYFNAIQAKIVKQKEMEGAK
jgi:hypothetical protein